MIPWQKTEWSARRAAFAALGSAMLVVGMVSGCGMPGAPLPPSLNLPQPVRDLRAVRTGNQVSLDWTMPRRNTDKLLLKDALRVKICRAEGHDASHDASCALAAELTLEPGKPAAFTDALPGALVAGKPRALRYFVEVENARERSAGPSNAAHVVAGEAPPPVAGLEATVRKSGVELKWTPVAGDATPVRIERLLLTPPAKNKKQKTGPLDAPVEPLKQSLLVTEHVAAGKALDRGTRFDEAYLYRAQRVARVAVEGQKLELAGKFSEPVRVEVRDVFPPDVPEGLAAVAASPESGASIDLNWQPNTEVDLAGYIVYRREGEGPWQRISPAKPLAEPAFHDASVVPGHSYRYAVTAVDLGGHESRRSAEAEETVPTE
jgi:hypothetical protein